jgi:RNA polymerase sigma-70 factor (ECF subfamily)
MRDAHAYEVAYRRFGARLYASALRILRDTGQAQDCVHDVLLHLWRRGDAYSSQRGSLEAFLVTCVRNDALTRVRKEARRSALAAAQREPASYEPTDVDPIQRERIARAIQNLTPLQAQMVRRAYYGGSTHAEIADDIGEPVGTVKSRIAAALRALRRTLREEGNDER